MMEIEFDETINPNEIIKQALIDIDIDGYKTAPRGLLVKEIELAKLNLSPLFPIIDFKSRSMNWKYLLGEFVWYLKRDTNPEYISNFSSFWGGITNPDGSINSNYGAILFGEQLDWVKTKLLEDQNTRQAIAFLNQPKYQYPGNKDFVCTMYLNFWIRDNKLNLKVQMRSNDIFYGTTYDVAFFAMVQQTMWIWLRDKYTELELGTYYHCADNLHFYERHFNLAEQIMNETIKTPYLFLLKAPLFEINNKQYSLTDAGEKMISEVDGMLESGTTITQEIAFQTLHNYFHIQ